MTTLTPAEYQVLVLAAHGLNDREIALQLGRKIQTVKNQLSHTYLRLGVANRTNAFIKMGWLKPPELL